MTVRSTNGSDRASRSERSAKPAETTSARPKAAGKAAINAASAGSTGAATNNDAAKKAQGLTVRSNKASGHLKGAKRAEKAAALASTSPNLAEGIKRRGTGVTKAPTGDVGKKASAIRAVSIRASGRDLLPVKATAAKPVAVIRLPPKTAAAAGLKLANQASAVIARASQAGKTKAVSAFATYNDAATQNLDRAEEILTVASQFVGDVTGLQQTLWRSFQRSIRTAAEMRAQFAVCTSFADIAEANQAVMRQGFDEWLNIAQEILMENRRITDRAINALELR